MHSSVDVRQMILLPSSRSAMTQTPSTGDSGLQQQTQKVPVNTCLVKHSALKFTSWPQQGTLSLHKRYCVTPQLHTLHLTHGLVSVDRY